MSDFTLGQTLLLKRLIWTRRPYDPEAQTIAEYLKDEVFIVVDHVTALEVAPDVCSVIIALTSRGTLVEFTVWGSDHWDMFVRL